MSLYRGVMALQIAVHIATGALKTSGGRSATDRQTAFSNSYGDGVAISGVLSLSYHRPRGSMSLFVCLLSRNVSHVCVEGRESRPPVKSEPSARRWRPSSSHSMSGPPNPPQLDFAASDFRGSPPNALAVSQQPRGHLWKEPEDNCSFELTTSKG